MNGEISHIRGINPHKKEGMEGGSGKGPVPVLSRLNLQGYFTFSMS